jgi:hypothetical protein
VHAFTHSIENTISLKDVESDNPKG